MARRWLITGATGRLGDYLAEACRRDGPVTTTSRSGGDRPCDLIDPVATGMLLREVKPDVVVHAAGLTDVDACERDPQAAFAANRDTAVNLAAHMPPSARLVFISTDQVYPDVPGPHGESDADPVNVYGRSKLDGEQATLALEGALVLRTNFFGLSRRPGRESLSDHLSRALAARAPVVLFGDILFSPLLMATLADLVLELVEKSARGVLNLGCREGLSKAAFGLAIARAKGLPIESARVGSSSELPHRAARAHDLRLDVARIEKTLGRPMPTLEEEISKL